MAPLDATSTGAAETGVDVEPPVNDRAGNLGLVLDEGVGLGQFAVAATGTARRQRDVVGLVDLLGDRPAVMPAMVLPALAAELLGIRFALLAKGGRLAFARAFDFFESLSQLLNLLDQVVNDRLLLFQQRLALRASGGDLGHIHDSVRFTPNPPRSISCSVNKYESSSSRRRSDCM